MNERKRTLKALHTLKRGHETQAGSALSRALREVEALRERCAEALARLAAHRDSTLQTEARPAPDAAALQQADAFRRGRALQAAQLRARARTCREALAQAEGTLAEARRRAGLAQAQRVLVERRQAHHAREAGLHEQRD